MIRFGRTAATGFDPLEDAIRRHGGQGRMARDRFNALGDGERAALLAFLGSL